MTVSDIVSSIGDYCSVAGLLVSVATLIYAGFINRRIAIFKKQFLFNARVPSILQKLTKDNYEFRGLITNRRT